MLYKTPNKGKNIFSKQEEGKRKMDIKSLLENIKPGLKDMLQIDL